MTKKVKIKSNKKWLYKCLYSHDFYHRQFSQTRLKSSPRRKEKFNEDLYQKKPTKKQVYGLTAGLIQVRETENYSLSAFWFVSVEAQISDLCSLWNLIFLVMTDVTDMQFNLHNQGPPAWRLSIAGSLWLLDSSSHHPWRDSEEKNWWVWMYLHYSCLLWQQCCESCTVDRQVRFL